MIVKILFYESYKMNGNIPKLLHMPTQQIKQLTCGMVSSWQHSAIQCSLPWHHSLSRYHYRSTLDSQIHLKHLHSNKTLYIFFLLDKLNPD